MGLDEETNEAIANARGEANEEIWDNKEDDKVDEKAKFGSKYQFGKHSKDAQDADKAKPSHWKY